MKRTLTKATRNLALADSARKLAFGAIALATSAAALAQETTRPFAAPSTVSSPAPSGIASLG